MKHLALPLIFFMTLISCSHSEQKPEPPLGPKCLEQCKTPFGKLLGSAGEGLEAYSNCQASCVVWRANKIKTAGQKELVYTGVKWQCVEYARRWLLVNKGVVYGSVDYAYEIWDKIKMYQSPDKKITMCTSNYANGSKIKPLVGDLLIYAKEFEGTGHVAVITQIDKAGKWIRVAEENNLNTRWPGNYARQIKLQRKSGGYWLPEKYLLGWKRANNQSNCL